MTLEGAETCQPVLIPFPSGVAWAHSRGCRTYPGRKISAQAPWHDGPEEGGEGVAAPSDAQGPEGTERTASSENRGARDQTVRAATSSRLARRHAIESRRTGLDFTKRRHPAGGTLTATTDRCPAHPSYLWWECPTCSERES